MNFKKLLLGVGLVVSAQMAGASEGQTTQPISSAELAATTCFQCHGPEGKYVQENTIPPLVGYPADAMYKQLLSFKSGERANTIMLRHVKGYSDEELQAIAQYFSSLKP